MIVTIKIIKFIPLEAQQVRRCEEKIFCLSILEEGPLKYGHTSVKPNTYNLANIHGLTNLAILNSLNKNVVYDLA